MLLFMICGCVLQPREYGVNWPYSVDYIPRQGLLYKLVQISIGGVSVVPTERA
jgi:hypothetical protein